jgi:hypothetical protein
MLKLSLTKRAGKIGGSINTRTEKHGTDEVPGLDIPIGGLLINAEELALLTDCHDAHERLFAQDTTTGHVAAIPAIETYYLDHKFENATVRMTGSSIEAATFGNAKIKGIKLQPQTGGLTMVAFTLQVNPENGIDVPKLLNAKISIGIKSAELETEADDEPELPLEHEDQGEEEEDDSTGSADIDETRKGRREVKRKKR